MGEYERLKIAGYNVESIDCDILHDATFIKDGANGEVYRLGVNECIKLWNWNSTLCSFYVDKLNKFTNLSVKCAVFPKKIIFMKGKIQGYMMDYIEGSTIDDCSTMEFSKFIYLYDKLLQNIRVELSRNSIRVTDIKSDNIMYDVVNDEFRCIDVDAWSFYDAKKFKRDVYDINFRQFKYVLEREMLGLSSQSSIQANDNLIEFYEGLRDKKEQMLGVKIKTVNDFKVLK